MEQKFNFFFFQIEFSDWIFKSTRTVECWAFAALVYFGSVCLISRFTYKPRDFTPWKVIIPKLYTVLSNKRLTSGDQAPKSSRHVAETGSGGQ